MKPVSHTVFDILYPNLRVEKVKEVMNEEVDKIDEAKDQAPSVIAELITTSWSGSNEEQMKAVQLLKGIALSDEEVANKFMKALDKFTSGLNAEDYK